MTDTITPLFTAGATATGGRNGRTEADDGLVAVDLSVPKAMGGAGKPGATTPEHLFAAGYAACFGGAVDVAAAQRKVNGKGATVAARVSIGPREGGGFGLTVALDVRDPGIPQAQLEEIVKAAHETICPYSHATRGNVDVRITVTGG